MAIAKLTNDENQLLIQTLCNYCIVAEKGVMGYLPVSVFDFGNQNKEWDRIGSSPIEVSNYCNYKFWFGIYDDFEGIVICKFYYPINPIKNQVITVLCEITGFPLIKVSWVHGHNGLSRYILIYLAYAGFLKDAILTEKCINTKLKLKRILNKCLSVLNH